MPTTAPDALVSAKLLSSQSRGAEHLYCLSGLGIRAITLLASAFVLAFRIKAHITLGTLYKDNRLCRWPIFRKLNKILALYLEEDLDPIAIQF